ncbi:MAG: hypothetical protein MSIBF_04870, partial [Candidatus Altiarchaeales archaeon IMC4]
MAVIRKLVLDVLKPHEPGIVEFAQKLSDLAGVDGVNISVSEMDKKVENVKITIEGRFSKTDHIKDTIFSLGGTIHSTDEVVAGKRVVDEEETLHDRKIR